jgi:hypothetical protein
MKMDGTPLSVGAVFAVVAIAWILLGKTFKFVLKWALILAGLLFFAVVFILKGIGVI